ncbi:hypothetical protein [Gordonia sp. NPDC003376]
MSKSKDPENDTGTGAVEAPPTQIRVAGALTTFEGAVALIFAIVLVIREMAGHHEDFISGYGTALWFGIIFGGVLVGGVALLVGRRWGRAISLVAQLLLLPVAYYVFTSGQALFAIPLALLALTTLVMLFTPASLRWISADLVEDDAPPRPPSSGRSGARGQAGGSRGGDSPGKGRRAR